ncbi:MAG: aldolase [Planctomycetes bacterium]|nr:aldolase [Planctomycetota bacterium]
MNAKVRLNRLLRDGRCFDVALDHGFFNEPAFLAGIEDLDAAVRRIAEAGPDAMQLSIGQAALLQRIPARTKPALVLRTDVANCYGLEYPRHLFSRLIDEAVEQAVRLDAACLCVNLLLLPDREELHEQCIANICKLKPASERYGMPLMVEPLVMKKHADGKGYTVDGDLNRILALVRQGKELGADLIKCDPCDEVAEFHRIVEAAGCPVLPRGGGLAPDKEIFERTAALMKQGARGIVYGRNVIQHANPRGMTRAFLAIVHEGADAPAALRILESTER